MAGTSRKLPGLIYGGYEVVRVWRCNRCRNFTFQGNPCRICSNEEGNEMDTEKMKPYSALRLYKVSSEEWVITGKDPSQLRERRAVCGSFQYGTRTVPLRTLSASLTHSLHRYVRLIVHCISHWSYKSYPIPSKPTYTEQDVTVIIPTIHHNFEELRPSLESILATNPYELIIVTTTSKFDALMKLARTLNLTRIRIFCIPVANKRLQVCKALPYVTTPITIMADDDVTWPKTLMPWILAPLKNERIGGVSTCQRVRRDAGVSILWRASNWLGACYIERRNFEISATHNIDGGTSCMSGRTGAYRTDIFRDPAFQHSFKTERWRDFILNADDDNFVTRWLVSHGWKTWVQYERECEVETALEYGLKFLYQCSRWARSNWRSNWTSLVVERHVWRQQPWSTYALHIATFTSLAFVFDPLILASLWWGTADWDNMNRCYAFGAMLVFFAFTKVVKLMGLFKRNPKDLMFLPLSIVFGYFHGLIKLYALFTLNVVRFLVLAHLGAAVPRQQTNR
ncbi:hypothetical protein GGTG_12165 [Gaeumannomyces tritici R3-111a-1]|uniref:Polysaccharide synthase Cps1p n=1 Tax=Gaeumannomyces tritici (strain R3-111a-1) TaxID=644352 RepID=J3PF86_GAET3|nr:hypothetical protein GGTG_12165 [Gaeumannomyces tritici R3-111a-1]EJT69988.1 hypothetical protein GGTG_12165 [Gaeumannomyces tritici R3-111a-1]